MCPPELLGDVSAPVAVIHKQISLPFGEGQGGGFGKRLVACSWWPVETRFYAVSYTPPPTPHTPTNNPPSGLQPPPPVGEAG